MIPPPDPPDPLADADVVVTNTPTTGTETADGEEVLSWHGFERFAFNFVAATYRFVGSDRDESVESYSLDEVRLGGGDDAVLTGVHPAPGTVIDGGAGHDFVKIGACAGTATTLLARDVYRCRDTEGTATSTLPGIEDVTVVAKRVDLRGTSAAEKIVAKSCGGEIHGYGGNDRIRARALADESFGRLRCRIPANGVFALSGGAGNDALYGRSGPDRLVGGPGDDVMYAGPGRDTLLGGPGHDRAYGARGLDTCRAEVEHACEQ